MDNLRVQVELDLHETIESEFKIEVELTGPDGVTQIYSKNNPTEKLGGQVLYYSRVPDAYTGERIVTNFPVISLRVSSLDRVPVDGEMWYLKFATSPVSGAPKRSFVFTETRAIESGTDIGFIKIYPHRVESDGEVS